MGRAGKRERARVKNLPGTMKVTVFRSNVGSAGTIAEALGRKHLRRFSRWQAKGMAAEYGRFRLIRHQGGNRKHDVHRESTDAAKTAALLVVASLSAKGFK